MLAAACGGSDTDEGSGGRLIAYVCSQGERYGLCVVGDDGRDRRELTHGDIDVDSLAWSHDGETIAYRCIRRICLIDVDGGDPREIPFSPKSDENMGDTHPAWSPVRHEVAFARNDGVSGVFVAGDDGEPELVVEAGAAIFPSWSPDGEQIAFGGISSGKDELLVVDRDGSGLRPLTRLRADDIAPSWSPNGKWIAFQAIRGSFMEVHVVGPEGRRARPIARFSRGALHYVPLVAPRWSPDSSEIAFPWSSEPEERMEIRVARVDGTGVRTLATYDYSLRAGNALMPDWSPDGALVQPRLHGPDLDLFTVTDGRERQLTNEPSFDYWPVWQPG